MNVRFFGGRKEEYVSIPKHNPIGLYFCADTRELFLGDKLLSDGLRVVATFNDLPSISEHKAAEGVIYFVAETKNGYVLPRGGYDWLQVIYAPTSGEGAEVDLSNYYTKAEVDEAILKAIANIEINVDLSGYATEAYVDEKVAAINIPKVPTKVSELENDKGYVTYKELPVGLSQNVYALDFSGYRTSDRVTPEQDEALSKLFDSDFRTPRKPSAIVYIKDSQLDNTWRLVDKVQGSYVVQADRLEFSTVLSVDKDDDSATLNELLFTFERFRSVSDASDVGTWFIKDATVLKSTKLVTDTQLAEVKQRIDALQKMPTKLSELENDTGFITEHQNISHLATKEEIAAIQEQIANIPTADLTGYATEEFVIRKIAEAELADQDVDLSAYYTKSETEAAIKSAVDAVEVPDVSGFATKEELEAVQAVAGSNSVKLFAVDEELFDIKQQLENIPTTDLSDYATKEEVATVEAKIPSIEGLATKQELEEAISGIEHPTINLEGYATEDWVNTQGFLKEHQDLSEYAKKSDIPQPELFVVDYNAPNFAAALEAYNSGKLLLLTNAAPDATGYAVMNYVRDDMITFTKFLMSRKQTHGAFNTYYLSANNTWEVSKEVKLNKVDAVVDSNKDITGLTIGEHTYDLDHFATTETVNQITENIENNYVSNTTLEEKNYVTEQHITENYITVQEAANTYVTNEKVTEVVTQEVETVVTEQIETKVETVIQEKVDNGEITAQSDSISYDTW